MQLLFRSLPNSEMERPPTQRDQFDNDEVDLVDALVRESLQNSLDAMVGDGPVRVRIAVHAPQGDERAELRRLLCEDKLRRHLDASNVDTQGVDFENPKLLVIEDFGTTGLTGRWDAWDEGAFCDFWRRMGLSHKGGRSLGRWGLGKLVFSSASRVRTFFGLTVRAGETSGLLMGQAVLTHHQLEGEARYDSHGFFAVPAGDGMQLPATSAEVIAGFSSACGLTRTSEPGLSVVVPHFRDSMKLDRILEGVLKNYFFPILLGRLEVTVGDVEVSAATFESLARIHGGARFAGGHLARFIGAMQATRQRQAPEPVALPGNWHSIDMEAAIGEQTLADLRREYAAGTAVSVRAPLLLKRKDGREERTHVDLFLQRAPADAGDTLFVRDAIVLPAEAKYFRGRNVFAALVADDRPVSGFLGDAENPAHTSWSGSTEKVTGNWRNAAARLREIRDSLQRVYAALVSAIELTDPTALVGTFSAPGDDGVRAPRPRGPVVRPPKVPPRPSPKVYRVDRMSGGFALRAGPGLLADMLPVSIRVRTAYDVLRGNPFSKHDPLDFDFRKKQFVLRGKGATLRAESANVLVLEATEPDFHVEVTGFDTRRDLIIDPARVQ